MCTLALRRQSSGGTRPWWLRPRCRRLEVYLRRTTPRYLTIGQRGVVVPGAAWLGQPGVRGCGWFNWPCTKIHDASRRQHGTKSCPRPLSARYRAWRATRGVRAAARKPVLSETAPGLSAAPAPPLATFSSWIQPGWWNAVGSQVPLYSSGLSRNTRRQRSQQNASSRPCTISVAPTSVRAISIPHTGSRIR